MRRTKHVEELIEDDEQKPDFDDMMNEVQEEIEEHDAEDAVVSRALELVQLSENIDKATNTWINATLQLESAIRKYNSAQTALGNAVDTISGKVDTINTHIDNVLKDAPTKLKVSVRVDDVDWKKIQDMFDKQHEWMTTQMQKHIREVNQMFYEERRRVQKGTRSTTEPTSDTMCSISSGSSLSLDSLFSAWLSSRCSTVTTTGQSNLMFIPPKSLRNLA